MDIQQILKVLKNERECIARQVDMTKCKRHEHEGCLKCDLCLPDSEILEVYDFLINGYELLQNEGAESYMIKCKEPLSDTELGFLRDSLCDAESFTVSFEPMQFPDNIRAIFLGEEQEEDTHDN